MKHGSDCDRAGLGSLSAHQTLESGAQVAVRRRYRIKILMLEIVRAVPQSFRTEAIGMTFLASVVATHSAS